MNNLKKWAFLALTTIALISCTDKEDVANPTFSIKLDHSAKIGDVLYDGNGNGFTLTKLKYFVTDIVLTKSNGEKVAVDNEIGATIIDLASVTDQNDAIVYNDIVGVEKGNYTSVSFKIGVDEEIYSQGEDAQGKLLELATANANDMLWSWTTGYIFLKIEGELTGTTGTNDDSDDHSDDHVHTATINKPSSINHNGTDHELEGTAFLRHVGNTGTGDTRTDRVQEVEINFNGEEAVIGNVDSSIHLKVDVAKFLAGTNAIDVVTEPGGMTTSSDEIADNLTDVFSFDHKH